jgi:hypothetical protein
VSDAYIRENFNSGAPLQYAQESLVLSDLIDACDFLKIDTDGFDLKVLHGAERMIDAARPLMIVTEAHFNGDPECGDSTVSGVDDFLRRKGYTWLDIAAQRYGRAALPQQFRYRQTSCTSTGPIGYADVTHVDDPLSRDGKLDEWLANGLDRSYKLLALYDVLGFPDCAAELIAALAEKQPQAADWRAMLHILDPNYETTLTRFRASPSSFYPET